MMRTKILVIDDEEALCEILKYNLEKEGYEVDCAYSAEEALDLDNLEDYSLFMVDIMMDKLSGFDFAKRIRNITALETKPILFCSALSDEDHVVKGLNIGADDYVTKPFVIGEVLARVRAILRRSNALAKKSAEDIIEQQRDYESDVVFRGLRIDRNNKEVYIDNEPVTLTRTEYDVLLFFLTHRNRIYSREEIIKNVWGDAVVVTGRTIDTNITRLRRKLGSYDQYIVTRPGFGYGFKEKD
ncbi:MAG: response regulator transcription factor [Bacteroidales bacterium]|nr:response regulator transcription factor [Bacteroidales bacterium]MBD5220643.1 response regulator transcription factor [Bacteroidales bacterium]MDE6436424.1 response regulator transcription factor [Muribaculaceae bacterium]